MVGAVLQEPRPHESSPVLRVATRINEWISRHTPKGREQEYLGKWSHVLEGIQGPARYELEKRLAADAAKYARNRVVRDVLVAVAATGGLVVGALGVNELRKRGWNIGGLFTDLGASLTHRTKDIVTGVSKTATTWAMTGAGQAITDNPHLVGGMVSQATEQATEALREAAQSPNVHRDLRAAGAQLAGAVADGAANELKARTSALPLNTRAGILSAVSDFLSRFTAKK